jgi:hypothetical protein
MAYARLRRDRYDLSADAQTIRAALLDACDRQRQVDLAVRQFTAWGDTDEGRHILIAVARYLAAHSLSERAALQTADIARRRMRVASCIGKVGVVTTCSKACVMGQRFL